MARDVVFMVPSLSQDGMPDRSAPGLRDYVQHLDGLVVRDSIDVDPKACGETPKHPAKTDGQPRYI